MQPLIAYSHCKRQKISKYKTDRCVYLLRSKKTKNSFMAKTHAQQRFNGVVGATAIAKNKK
jgi:hypothetical protein